MSIRILVLSQNKGILETVKRELSPLGHTIITCTSSALAMFLSNKNFPSVVLADQATDSSPKDFIAEMKADAHLSSIPVVVLSDPTDNTNWHSLGAAGCVLKPLQEGVLAYELAPFLRDVKDSREKETPE
jgi:DNA-binding response OmpR family regulator